MKTMKTTKKELTVRLLQTTISLRQIVNMLAAHLADKPEGEGLAAVALNQARQDIELNKQNLANVSPAVVGEDTMNLVFRFIEQQ